MAKTMGRSSLVFAAMTLISRAMGLLRDILIARYFDSVITDPFFAALRIPNTLRRFFAEGGFANAFVPVFSATRTEHPEKLKDLLQHTAGTLLGILMLITFIGIVFSGGILFLVANGLMDKPDQYFLANQMLKIMFPYILLISLTAMCGGILNTYGRFAIPAFTPVLLNVALIAACFWRAQQNHIDGLYGLELAWAVLFGGILQLGLQLPFLWRLGLLVRPKWGWQHSGVRKIICLMIPTLFGSSVGQLTILVNTFLASHLVTGSISWLYYSDRIVELPIALIGVALGTVILPKLSALKSSENEKKFVYTLDWAMRWGILVGAAASTGLVILAPSILMTLFFGGRFALEDVWMTTLSLRAYAVAVLFLILVKILAPAFYARQDTKTPVRAGIIAMLINIVVALILSRFCGHVGLAAASTIAALVNVSLLFYYLRISNIKIKTVSLWFLIRIVVANIAMAIVLTYLQGNLEQWTTWTRLSQIGHLLLLVSIGAMVYFAALYALGLRANSFKLGE